MKKILLLLGICLNLLANDILVFNNEYQVLPLTKKIKSLIVGNKKIINVSLLNVNASHGKLLKIFGKKIGNTSILIVYKDNSIENYHVYVNENLGYIQKMINTIEPKLSLSKVGNGSTVITGVFKDPHDKSRIYEILKKGGIDTDKLMDLTKTQKVNKMIRTKLYLIAVNNQRAKDLGGVTGLSFFNKYVNGSINAGAANAATFSGFLLDNLGDFTSSTGNSVLATLNFLQTKGITNVLDDTVLITTEDKNATFRVGGELYIPTGITQNSGTAPTIQVESKEYGLKLTLSSKFMQTEGYMHINVDIQDSNIDPNIAHNVSLGQGISIPSFISKNIQTNVVVKSAQVIALGGRLYNENTKSEEKVPLLGDIPFLGELFKHNIENLSSNDLIFLLVPEIVDANENIDDTHFYQNFKDSTTHFNAKVLNKEDTTQKPMSKTQTMQEENLAAEKPIIVSYESNEDLNDENNTKELLENNISITPTVQIPKAQKYVIDTQKIFIRSAPVDGKPVSVWKKGHVFTTKAEKTLQGKTWLQIDQDCNHQCKNVDSSLWVVKRYTKKI